MSREAQANALELLAEHAYRRSRRKFYEWFPAEGPYRRELYPRHMLFVASGAKYKTRAFVAANRVGKTTLGAYELTCHLTGIYPDWWNGYRFTRAIDAWVAGKTTETTRDILQHALFGPPSAIGTGMIPGDLLGTIRVRPNAGGAIDTAEIRHVSGRMSNLGLKSYEQRRKAFEGTAKDIVWLDEEAPPDVRDECGMRLMSVSGLMIETFTPLDGITPTIELYRGKGARVSEEHGLTLREGRISVNAGWDHVPHLTEEEKERRAAETLPYLLEARRNGIPSMGAGAIYPIVEAEIKVKDFAIPAHWKRAYALDVGWNRTAAIWGAMDPESDCLYLYAEHYRGQAEPVIHATAIKARGEWMRGGIDPAARGRGQDDGKRLFDMYKELGLQIQAVDNAVESGLYAVWQRLSTGRLKVFASLGNFFAEYRLYRRDEKGRIIKENDHCLHPDTVVITRSGRRRIVDMVGSSGEVLSVGGKWTAYRNCRMTAADQPIVSVHLSDGTTIRCTPDHRFLTPRGWVEAKDMEGVECYNSLSHSIQLGEACPPVRCLRVSDAGRSDVYCLTVPETEAFAVESGVVVHNCMDCARYLCLNWDKLASLPVPKRITPRANYGVLDDVAGY